VFSGALMSKYGLLDGSTTTYFKTPSAAANKLTSSVEIVVGVAAADWTPAATTGLVGKWLSTGNQRSYAFRLNTTGTIQFARSANGTAQTLTNSTVSVPFVDGARWYIKTTYNHTTGDVKFFTSQNGDVYTQLGATVSTAAGAIFDSTSELQVGAFEAGSLLTGRVFYASVSGTIGGAPTAVFNPQRYSGGTTFTASTGEVWTLNGAAKILAGPA